MFIKLNLEMCLWFCGILFPTRMTLFYILLFADTLYAICKAHPNIVRPNPYDCAQFIDCSKSRPGHVIGEYVKECPYPKLFSTDTMECQEYNKVLCNTRREPRAPCMCL